MRQEETKNPNFIKLVLLSIMKDSHENQVKEKLLLKKGILKKGWFKKNAPPKKSGDLRHTALMVVMVVGCGGQGNNLAQI